MHYIKCLTYYYYYYYRSNLFGGLTLHLGLGLTFMFQLLSRLCSTSFVHSFWVLYFSSLEYKVLNVLAFFCKQHCHSFWWGMISSSGNCEITVAGYHLLSFGSMYITFWPMGISCVRWWWHLIFDMENLSCWLGCMVDTHLHSGSMW